MALRGEYWWVRLLGDGGLEWARCASDASQPREEGRCAGWDELPAPEGARLVICVPPAGVRVHTVTLPTRNRKRFRAALPFALEDQLLHDPEDYHFVPLPRAKDRAGSPVAVVEQARMEGWLEGLAGRGWRPRILVPEFLAVAPPAAGSWLLDAAESPMLLRLPRGGGGAALAGEVEDQPPGGLVLALEGAVAPPETLNVRVADRGQAERVGRWAAPLESRGVTLNVLEDGRSRGPWLARQPLPERGCNLLTGPFASGEDPRQWLKRLAPAGALAAALLLVAGTEWVLEGARIRNEHQRLEQAIAATYREAFPEARNLVDPRYQMEQRLQRLREGREGEGETDGGLLVRLQSVAPMLAGGGDGETRVSGLTYDGDRLTLDISVPDYEALERLKERLADQGEVAVENAELKDGRVHGRIRIQGQA